MARSTYRAAFFRFVLSSLLRHKPRFSGSCSRSEPASLFWPFFNLFSWRHGTASVFCPLLPRLVYDSTESYYIPPKPVEPVFSYGCHFVVYPNVLCVSFHPKSDSPSFSLFLRILPFFTASGCSSKGQVFQHRPRLFHFFLLGKAHAGRAV